MREEIEHLRAVVLKLAVAIRDIPMLIKRIDMLERRVEELIKNPLITVEEKQ